MLKKIIILLKEFKMTRILLNQRFKGFLFEQGWFSSYMEGKPQKSNGEPIPWMTYSFIFFLKNRLRKDMVVLEYGSGNSTFFLSKLVKQVVSIEHNKDWYNFLNNKIPANVKVYLQENLEDYVEHPNKINIKFDVIIVDGVERNKVLEISPKILLPNGVIILDNSNRKEYSKGINFILDKGYKKIDFWGMIPGTTRGGCTSIIYKSKNCFEI